MQRDDRAWTAVMAEVGLDRAQQLLRLLNPALFGSVDLAAALRASGELPVPETQFRTELQPRMRSTLGALADAVFDWLASLPFGGGAERPAADFWWLMWLDLQGEDAPTFETSRSRDRWNQFVSAWRGRLGSGSSASWLKTVNDDAHFSKEFRVAVAVQRRLAFTPHDRALYARFGWNDAGDMRGLASLTQAVTLERTRRAWRAAAPYFDAGDQQAIEAAAHRVTRGEVEAAWGAAQQNLDDDCARYGVTPEQLQADLYSTPKSPPPLSAILSE